MDCQVREVVEQGFAFEHEPIAELALMFLDAFAIPQPLKVEEGV